MQYVTKDDEDFHGRKILLVTQPQKPPVTSVRTPIPVLDLAEYYRKYASADVTCATLDRLPEGMYDYVGYSVLAQNDDIEKEISLLSKTYPSARIIVGGKWATDPGKEIDVNGSVVFFSGPGELLVTDKIDYGEYPGWNYKDLITPGFDLRNLGVMTTRGCPYRCHFCHNTEKKINRFDPSRTVNNMKMGFERLNISTIYIIDDIFTSSAKRMRDLLNLSTESGLDIRNRSRFLTHVNFVKDDILEMIGAYKPWRVEIGIESGSTEQLKRMGKTFTSEQAYAAVEKLLDKGVPLSVLILVGFPGETIETLKDTLKFVNYFRKKVQYVGLSYYQPVRNTVGWDMCVERLGEEPEIGMRAHRISYVDPNLTREVLTDYGCRIKAGAGVRN